MNKIILKYGLIAGAIVTAFMVGSTIAMKNNPDFQGSMLLGYTGMLVAFSFVFIGIKNYRDKQNNGLITFMEALKIGTFISLIAATIYVGVWLIEYYCFFPDFMEKYAATVLNNMHKAGASAADIEAKAVEMESYKEMYKNPLMVILWTYAEVLIPIGLLVPIISAAVLKKTQPAGL